MEKEEFGPLFSVSLSGWGFLGMAGGLAAAHSPWRSWSCALWGLCVMPSPSSPCWSAGSCEDLKLPSVGLPCEDFKLPCK